MPLKSSLRVITWSSGAPFPALAIGSLSGLQGGGVHGDEERPPLLNTLLNTQQKTLDFYGFF